MGECEFLNQVEELMGDKLTDNNFFKVDSNEKYVPTLAEIYLQINDCAKQNGLDYIEEFTEKIQIIICQYLNGKIGKALGQIGEILKPLVNDSFICSEFNKSGCFTGYVDSYDASEIALYRGRISKTDLENGEKDLYHIPFNKRELVGSERFSIPGVPCLYLGRSIYTCWNELGKPQDSDFYISKVTVENSIRNFNLAINLIMLKKMVNHCKFSGSVENLIKLWILKLACSCVVKQDNRRFKSEYIIPQLIMCELVNSYDICSITYFTNRAFKTLYRDSFAPLSVNVAIVAQQMNNEEYAKDIGDNIKFTKPVNFAEYKQIYSLRKIEEKVAPNEDIDKDGNTRFVDLAGGVQEYQRTEFIRLERYIEAL